MINSCMSVSFIIAVATATLDKGNAITRMLHQNRSWLAVHQQSRDIHIAISHYRNLQRSKANIAIQSVARGGSHDLHNHLRNYTEIAA